MKKQNEVSATNGEASEVALEDLFVCLFVCYMWMFLTLLHHCLCECHCISRKHTNNI